MMMEESADDYRPVILPKMMEAAPPESSPVFDLPPPQPPPESSLLSPPQQQQQKQHNKDDADDATDHDDRNCSSHYSNNNSSGGGYDDDDESTTSLRDDDDEYLGYGSNSSSSNNNNAAFPDFPSWISELEDINPFANMEPTLFPYHIPTGFSVGVPPSSRRLSGTSTIVTTTTATISPFGNNNDEDDINNNGNNGRKGTMKLSDALDVLKIRLLLEKTHTSHLERVRPTVRVVWSARRNKLHSHHSGSSTTTTKDLWINLPEDNPKVIAIRQVEAEIQKINTLRDRLLPLHKKLFWLAMDVKATRMAHSALRRSIRLRNLILLPSQERTTRITDREEDAYLFNLLGKTQLELGQPAWAVSNFQNALDILYSLQSNSNNNNNHDDNNNNNRGSSSSSSFESSSSSGPFFDPIDFGNTLSLMGEAQLATNNPELALSSFDKALTIYKREREHTLVVETARSIGKIYCSRNNNNNNNNGNNNNQDDDDDDLDLDSAIKLHKEILDFNKQYLGENHELVADSYMALGDCYVQKKKKKQQQQQQQPADIDNNKQQQQQQHEHERNNNAMECYQEALSIFRSVVGDDHELVTDALVALGDLYCTQTGQEERALFYYGEVHKAAAASTSTSSSSSSSTSTFYMEYVVLKIAILLFQQGQTSLALTKFQDVLRICREGDTNPVPIPRPPDSDAPIHARRRQRREYHRQLELIRSQGIEDVLVHDSKNHVGKPTAVNTTNNKRHSWEASDGTTTNCDSEPYFNALISSAVCFYVQGNKEGARKSFKDAITMSCQSSMFVNTSVVEKMLKVSLARVDSTRIGKAIGGIVKRSVLMQGDNKHPPAESDLETINESVSEAMWFYYMDSDSVGKFADGWIPFEVHAGLQLEDMYQNWISSKKHQQPLGGRLVGVGSGSGGGSGPQKTTKPPVILSESSGFSYEINFQRMTQTNTVTKRIRPIERTQDGRAPTSEPMLDLPKYDVDAPKYYDQETIAPRLDAREPSPNVGTFSSAFPLQHIKL